MATGGVWNLLQVLFALFAHGHRRRKPSAPGAFWTVLLMEQVAKATCILCKKLQRTRGGTWRFPRVSRAKSGILWLSGGTTRFRWRGASYLGPSMRLTHDAIYCFRCVLSYLTYVTRLFSLTLFTTPVGVVSAFGLALL